MDATGDAHEAGPDHADVRASVGGDQDAFARLIRRHQGSVAARLWKFTRDRQVLEELVQEAFVQAYLSLRGYRGRGSFAGWLNRIATRVGYRYWKRLRREKQVLPLEDWDAVSDPGSDAARPAGRLHALLARLAPRDRLVLTLLYWEGLSVAEAAEQTGWSRTMVKVQAHRARRRLKRLIEQDAAWEDGR